MAKQVNTTLSKAFTLIILAVILYLLFLIFRPFLREIIFAAILATILHPWYQKLLSKLKGHANITAFIMSFLILLLIIIPLMNVGYFLAQQSIEAYQNAQQVFKNFPQQINGEILSVFNLNKEYISIIQEIAFDIVSYLRDLLVDWASSFVKTTSQLVGSLVLVILTTFFIFRDGNKILQYLRELTPLPGKYDKLIFEKFKDVSYSVILGEFGAALAQTILALIGFIIVGLPSFILALLIFLTAFIPYIGTIIIWLPVIAYLFLTGQLWQGLFLIIWSIVVVGLSDNVIRPYLIKGKIKVHPLVVFFSIIGAIVVFGFWGVVIGPLIVAMAVVIFDIYKLEFIKTNK
ncbi:MAG: AI-2E family transporter [Candidatus Buchananbacteria bacterium]|nr:AI-2E family transporter [Candidatus Buchananbacteria bacterium]